MLFGNSEVEVDGGDNGDRTHDLRLAKPALSQLSYVPDNNRPSGDSASAGAIILKKKWWARQGSNL